MLRIPIPCGALSVSGTGAQHNSGHDVLAQIKVLAEHRQRRNCLNLDAPGDAYPECRARVVPRHRLNAKIVKAQPVAGQRRLAFINGFSGAKDQRDGCGAFLFKVYGVGAGDLQPCPRFADLADGFALSFPRCIESPIHNATAASITKLLIFQRKNVT